MLQYYLLNDRVEFWPDLHQLIVKLPFPQTVTLNVPTSRCLQLLIEKRPQVVRQQDFYSYVWGDQGSQVSVNALYQNIALLRKHYRALDMASGSLLVTVPKQGFQLDESLQIEALQAAETDPPEAPSTWGDAASAPVLIKTERFPGKQKTYVITLLFTVFLLGLMLMMGNRNGFELSTPPYKNAFVSLKTKNGCHYFINKSNAEFDSHLVNKSIAAQCDVKPWLYITLNQYSAASSILACRKKIDSEAPGCSIYTLIKR